MWHWSNDAENSALHHRNKLHFKLYWTVILNSNNISQYYRFTVFLIKYIQTWWAKKKKKKKKKHTLTYSPLRGEIGVLVNTF